MTLDCNVGGPSMALSIALKWAMKCWDIGVLEQSEKAPMPETQKCPMTGRNGCGLAASMTSWGLLGSLGTYQDLAGWLGAFWHLLGSPGNFETLGPHGLWGGARLRLGRAVRRFTSWIAPSLRLTWSALANLKRA